MSEFEVLRDDAGRLEMSEVTEKVSAKDKPDNKLAMQLCDILFGTMKDGDSCVTALLATVTVAANIIVNLEKEFLLKGIDSPQDVQKEFEKLLAVSVSKGRSALKLKGSNGTV